jgi:ribosomal-protein-alanine N-acetyltransferase
VQDADVELRELPLCDGAELVASAEARRVLHQPYIVAPDSIERFRSYFERSCREDQVAYLVRHRTCGELVGFVNLNGSVRGAFQSASLGYAAFEGHAGRGLMRQGVALAVERAFGTYRLHRLEANIQPVNVCSIALARSLGFEREGCSPRYLHIAGEWRDHERWALLAEQWAVLPGLARGGEEAPNPSRPPAPGSGG